MEDLFNENSQILEMEYIDNTSDFERSFRTTIKMEDNYLKNCIKGLSHLIEIFLGMGYTWEQLVLSFNSTMDIYNEERMKYNKKETIDNRNVSIKDILNEMESYNYNILEEEDISSLEKFKYKINNDSSFSNFMYDYLKKEIFRIEE